MSPFTIGIADGVPSLQIVTSGCQRRQWRSEVRRLL